MGKGDSRDIAEQGRIPQHGSPPLVLCLFLLASPLRRLWRSRTLPVPTKYPIPILVDRSLSESLVSHEEDFCSQLKLHIVRLLPRFYGIELFPTWYVFGFYMTILMTAQILVYTMHIAIGSYAIYYATST